MNEFDAPTKAKLAEAGELLIRAAAVLGTLTPSQQRELQRATNGGLPDSIAFALRGARAVSPEVDASLRTHPPQGLVDLKF